MMSFSPNDEPRTREKKQYQRHLRRANDMPITTPGHRCLDSVNAACLGRESGTA